VGKHRCFHWPTPDLYCKTGDKSGQPTPAEFAALPCGADSSSLHQPKRGIKSGSCYLDWNAEVWTTSAELFIKEPK
jgi:hypothetical protein